MSYEIKCCNCGTWSDGFSCNVATCCGRKYCCSSCWNESTFRCVSCGKFNHVCGGNIRKSMCRECIKKQEDNK